MLNAAATVVIGVCRQILYSKSPFISERQCKALVEAYEHGYYTIPREIDGSNLATSHQVLGKRLRRGVSNLIENTLVVDDEAK
ncbi:helix-turn-helix domain-containing protein [Haladaptatus halobius]|uniref:helix-turn-helix domain-containing protein n=1 Tax=Haladaptatus halobius TaxID=2884875 RepID=UPI001D0BDE18